ncbi:hypothetical protein [Olivibacter domesticus]|uniref:hypothetical protein n=1 Tax=Olivibacter domesticus TaxID=407022 RepID=UPI001EE46763|nr:hypothetical protein [Olivibacter domesticus]
MATYKQGRGPDHHRGSIAVHRCRRAENKYVHHAKLLIGWLKDAVQVLQRNLGYQSWDKNKG